MRRNDSGLLIAGEIKFLGQHLDHLSDYRHIALCGALAVFVFVISTRSPNGLLRGSGRCDNEHGPNRK
jgi:hypothetical protein